MSAAITEWVHRWGLTGYEDGVLKGVCACGAVSFFPSDGTKGFIERVKQLNHLFGEPGSGEHDWDKSDPAVDESGDNEAKESIGMFPHQDKPANPTNHDKPANASDSSLSIKERPPVPPKPKGGGPGAGASNKAVSRYYQDNRDAILKDLAEMGEKAMLKRWNISTATWQAKGKKGQPKGLAVRFGVIPGAPAPSRPNKKAGQAAAKTAPPAELTESELVKHCIKCEHLTASSGRMMCKFDECKLGLKLKSELKLKPEPLTPALPVRIGVASKPPAPAAPPQEPLTADAAQQPAWLRVMVVTVPAPLPRLPDFDPLWPSDVKMKWLDVLEKLAVKT